MRAAGLKARPLLCSLVYACHAECLSVCLRAFQVDRIQLRGRCDVLAFAVADAGHVCRRASVLSDGGRLLRVRVSDAVSSPVAFAVAIAFTFSIRLLSVV